MRGKKEGNEGSRLGSKEGERRGKKGRFGFEEGSTGKEGEIWVRRKFRLVSRFGFEEGSTGKEGEMRVQAWDFRLKVGRGRVPAWDFRKTKLEEGELKNKRLFFTIGPRKFRHNSRDVHI